MSLRNALQVLRFSAVGVGLVYGSMKLSYLKVGACTWAAGGFTAGGACCGSRVLGESSQVRYSVCPATDGVLHRRCGTAGKDTLPKLHLCI